MKLMIQIVAVTFNCLLIRQTLCQAAAISSVTATTQIEKLKSPQQDSAGIVAPATSAPNNNTKLKRETKLSALEHLDSQETFDYHHLPPAPPQVHHSSYPAPASTAESDYGYDAGKNSYGKQASDWSLYDQGLY